MDIRAVIRQVMSLSLPLAALLLAGCSAGFSNPDHASKPPSTPPAGPGSARQFKISDGSMDVAVDDAAGFDPLSTLQDDAIAFRHIKHDDGDFYIGYVEVTQGQWMTLAARAGFTDQARLRPWSQVTPASLVGGVEDEPHRPAFGVSEDLARSLISAVNAANAGGPRLRLATVGEWRRACRYDGTGLYGWGDQENLSHVASHAVVRETRVRRGADLVGGNGATRRSPNVFGLYDMHGNVWELVEEGDGSAAMCGGSWSDNLMSSRATNVQHVDASVGHALCGVRLVLEPVP